MLLSNEELFDLKGGAASVSGTFLNSISRIIGSLLDLGRTIGSAFRYKKSNLTC